MKRVGFVINSRVPAWGSLSRGMRPYHLVTGWDDSGSPMSFMRFRWVAGEVNRRGICRYELYKPWRNYDAVVFLKSMGPACEVLADRLRSRGTKVVFEANVDYYTVAPAQNLPMELAPTAAQREHALSMTRGADGVIASSRRLAEICRGFAPGAVAVPDNILPSLVPDSAFGDGFTGGKLNLWWSGMPSKLYDFLLIGDLLANSPVHLHFVTGDWRKAVADWPERERTDFEALLRKVSHSFHVYRGIAQLLRLYRKKGGVIVSPRYTDSPYNHSHTEWKLTLGLVCGMPGLGSPLESYLDASDVSGGQLRICHSGNEWEENLAQILADPQAAFAAAEVGGKKVLDHYGTPAVAAAHESALLAVLKP